MIDDSIGSKAGGSIAAFRDALESGAVLLDVPDQDISKVTSRLLSALVESGALAPSRKDEAHAKVMEREALSSTALGHGVSVPHARLVDLERPIVAMARFAKPVNMGAPDGRPVRFVFLLLGTDRDADVHLEMLMSVARLMADDLAHFALQMAPSKAQVFASIEGFLARKVPPPDEPERDRFAEEGLVRTGRFAGGLIGDIRRRLPHYASDFREALDSKGVGTALFLFFACIAPAVAFGGLMHELTGGQIGAMEMIVATSLVGVIYAFTSGQPLTIMGGTGPLLIFTAVLYDLSQTFGLSFLPVYSWVGLWMAGFVLAMALFDLSSLIRFCTRFTDEIFAGLISIIFINEALRDLWRMFTSSEYGNENALLALVLALGTFYIASSLRDFRKSVYLRHPVREFLADFGSVIAISAMVLVAYVLGGKEMPTLVVPSDFGTTTGRPWLVNLFDVPPWVPWAAALPAAVGTVLVYLDQNITSRLVNRPDHELKKGAGYHLDLTIVSVMMALCSLLGLPWLVAATVRSLNHVRALATVEERVVDGQVRSEIVSVRETRLTGIAIHVLIGASIFLLPVLLRYDIRIPMSVLFGLFLYMGVTSLAGNQFWERIKLWVMEPSSYPQTHYVRKVPLSTIHKFTAIQLVCLVVLWVVKTSPAALLFPLVIALLVFVRIGLNRVFDKEHLDALDTEEEPDEENLREVGA